MRDSNPRPLAPEAVGSNPALPKGKLFSRQQLPDSMVYLVCDKILVHCAKNGLRLSCAKEENPR